MALQACYDLQDARAILVKLFQAAQRPAQPDGVGSKRGMEG